MRVLSHFGKADIAILFSLSAIAVSFLALSFAKDRWEMERVRHLPPVDFRGAATTPYLGSCEERWKALPTSVRGAWPLGEFEIKCRANNYVALCENQTIEFDDSAEDVCVRSGVLLWYRVPDA